MNKEPKMKKLFIGVILLASVSSQAKKYENPTVNIRNQGVGLISCNLSPEEICSLINPEYTYARDFKCSDVTYSSSPLFHIKHKLQGVAAWLATPCVAPESGGCTADSDAPVYSRKLKIPIYGVGFRYSDDLGKSMYLSEDVTTLDDLSYVKEVMCE